ncbi:L,D-transpeptidase [Flexibacterium corallicola]|uniref:L,D-transpeptidase n=1 Tax=Flexibacterium corallicola TaxID=3037259 RepID=UPI00286F5045|nr:L,D-transpeptidase [Pseudovibrio sp. M1P-2-3]
MVLVVRIAVILVATAFSGGAQAQVAYQGRATPPPLVLSPNLSQPWTVQVSPANPRSRSRVTRSSVNYNSARKIPRQYLPATVKYAGPHSAGTILIDTPNKYLYLIEAGGKARRYGVGVGRPGFEWAGTHRVTSKKEWPDWRPPAAMRKRQPNLPAFFPGGPKNPLGARALYLGSTLYRIHGSNEPWTIGKAVSSGCIRMRNEDVIELYKMVGLGTTVIVR